MNPVSQSETAALAATTGTIINIQRFSTHDGPGIRTTVFLKGCSLRCFWCHNPEGIRAKVENQFYPERCIGCGECVTVCPEGAQTLDENGRVYHRERCVACGKCIETCYAEALVPAGRTVAVRAVMAEILADRSFYAQSGGGVTLSGGEPALQPMFSYAILKLCKDEGIHTAIETAAHVRWENLARLLPVTDLLMMDIKHMDSERHRAATGAPNRQILANARRLAETGKPMIIHVPVVPTVNDSDAEIADIARFVAELAAERAAACAPGETPAPISVELLPFHKLAGDKYRSLGLEYRAAELQPLGRARMAELAAVACAAGVSATTR